MATPKGNFTAYQQLTPTESPNFGEVARNVADREIAREAKEKAQSDKDRDTQKKISNNFKQDYDTLTNVITGTSSIDEAFGKGVAQARDRMGDIYKQIQSNPALGNDVSTQMELQNLRNYAKTLKISSDKITEFNTLLAEGSRDGSLSNWNKKHLNIADSIYRKSNLTVGVDHKGRAIAATVKVDDDGETILGKDGKPIVEELSLPQVMQGGGLPSLVPIYNMAEQAQSIGPDLGKKTVKKQDGSFSHIEYQNFEDIEGNVRSLVKGLIGNSSNPTDIAKSIWSDVLREDSSDLGEEDMKKVEDVYVNTIKSFYDETSKRETNLGARNSAIKEANRKKEVKSKDSLKQRVKSDFTVITDQDSKIEKKNFVGVSGDIQGMATSFSLPTDPKTKESSATVIGSNGNKVVVNEIYLLDSGELAYSGFELRGKITGQPVDPDGEDLGNLSSNVVKNKIGGGSDTDDRVLTSIAKVYGLENEGELKNLLKSKVKEFSNNPTEKSNALSIKSIDIEAKAKASGYSVEEYTKLLKEKGVKIK